MPSNACLACVLVKLTLLFPRRVEFLLRVLYLVRHLPAPLGNSRGSESDQERDLELFHCRSRRHHHDEICHGPPMRCLRGAHLVRVGSVSRSHSDGVYWISTIGKRSRPSASLYRSGWQLFRHVQYRRFFVRTGHQ